MIPRDSEYIKCCVGPIRQDAVSHLSMASPTRKTILADLCLRGETAAPARYRDTAAVDQDCTALTKAAASHSPPDGAFMTAASPGVVALFQVSSY